MRIPLTSLLLVIFYSGIIAQTARLQIIHDAPTENIDLYVNDILFLENFVFQTATPFQTVPADIPLTFSIAKANSQSVSSNVHQTVTTFEAGKTYIAIASGTSKDSIDINLTFFDEAREYSNEEDKVGLLFFNGSKDAPPIDVIKGNTSFFQNIEFEKFSPYQEVEAGPFQLSLSSSSDNDILLGEYQARFAFWRSRTAVIFTTGFLDGEEPGFQPWVALSNGGTFPLSVLVPPPPPAVDSNAANIQFIHNVSSGNIDFFINGVPLVEGLSFQTATPYLSVPANEELTISAVPSQSNFPQDIFDEITISPEFDRSYIIISNGSLEDSSIPFSLEIFENAQQTSPPFTVGITFFNGSIGVPSVDFITNGGLLFNDIDFGRFSFFVNLPSAPVDIDLFAGDGSSLGSYNIDLKFWEQKTALIFSSGTLNGSPAFQPWIALSNGGTFPLPINVNHPSQKPKVDLMQLIAADK